MRNANRSRANLIATRRDRATHYSRSRSLPTESPLLTIEITANRITATHDRDHCQPNHHYSRSRSLPTESPLLAIEITANRITTTRDRATRTITRL